MSRTPQTTLRGAKSLRTPLSVPRAHRLPAHSPHGLNNKSEGLSQTRAISQSPKSGTFATATYGLIYEEQFKAHEPSKARASRVVFVKDGVVSGKTICLTIEKHATDEQILQATQAKLSLPSGLQTRLLREGKLASSDTAQNAVQLTITAPSLLGGSINNDKGELDDHFKRVHDDESQDKKQDILAPAQLNQNGKLLSFEKAEDLLDVSAEQLALMVKDPDNPQKINLKHQAFTHPRQYWEKILSTEQFKKMPEVELAKLMMYRPGIIPVQDNIEGLKKQADCPLSIPLPEMEFLDERLRWRYDAGTGRSEYPEFLFLVRHKHRSVKTLYVYASFIGDMQNLQVQETYYFARMAVYPGETEPYFKECHKIQKPIPICKRVKGSLYFVNTVRQDILFFTKGNDEDDEHRACFLRWDSNDKHTFFDVKKDTALNTYLEKVITEPAIDYHPGMQLTFEPQLFATNENMYIFSFSVIDEERNYTLYLHNLDRSTDIAKFKGGHAILCQVPKENNDKPFDECFLIYADYILNQYVIKRDDLPELNDYHEFVPHAFQSTNVEYAQAFKATVDVFNGKASEQQQDLTQEGETPNGARNKIESDGPWQYAGISFSQLKHRFSPKKIQQLVEGDKRSFLYQFKAANTFVHLDGKRVVRRIEAEDRKSGDMLNVVPLSSHQSKTLNTWISCDNVDGAQATQLRGIDGNVIQKFKVGMTQLYSIIRNKKGYYTTLPDRPGILALGIPEAESGELELDRSMLMSCYFTQQGFKHNVHDPRSCWKQSESYPLTFLTNKFMPYEAYVFSILERDIGETYDTTSLIRLYFSQRIVLAAPRLRFRQEHDAIMNFGIAYLDGGRDYFRYIELKLKDPLRKDAIFDKKNWKVLDKLCKARIDQFATTEMKLNGKDVDKVNLEALLKRSSTQVICHSQRDPLQCFWVIGDNFIWVLGYQAGPPGRNNDGHIWVQYQPKELEQITRIKPVVNMDSFYFVVKDKEHQADYIYVKRPTNMEPPELIYKMQESDIIAMQPCHYTNKLRDYDNASHPMRLLILDSNLNLITMDDHGDGIEIIKTVKLSHHTGLAEHFEQAGTGGGICLSERTVTVGNQVFPVETENCAITQKSCLPSFRPIKAHSAARINTTPHSEGNAISYFYCGPEPWLQIQGDPGRRVVPFAHEQLCRDLRSFHQLSPDRFLLQIDPTTDDQNEERQPYWTMMSLGGQSLKLQERLGELLSEEDYKTCRAQSTIIKGGLTQLLLQGTENALKIVLNGQGTVLQEAAYKVQTAARILQNSRGELLQVLLSPDGKEFQVEQAKEGSLPLIKVGKLVGLDWAHEIVYLNDFLCIKLNDNEGQSTAQLTHDLRIYSLREKKDVTVQIMTGTDQVQAFCVAIDPCPPMNQLRQLTLDKINQEEYEQLGNRLQVTNAGRTDVYQVDWDATKNNIVWSKLVVGSGDSALLQDPNNFVEPGFIAAVATEPSQIPPDKVPEGQDEDEQINGRLRCVHSTQFGNVVTVSKRTICENSKILKEAKIRYRSLVGLYRKYSRMDLLMIEQALYVAANDNEQLTEVDIKALLADFGNASILWCIGPQLEMMQFIKNSIEEQDFEAGDPVLMHLAKKLTEKFMTTDAQGEVGIFSTVNLYFQQSAMRDTLLKIGQLCNEHFSVFTELYDQHSFELLFSNMSSTVISEMNRCIRPTWQTQEIKQIDWPLDQDRVVKMSHTSHVRQDLFKWPNELTQQSSMSVRVLDLQWLYRDKRNFVAFTDKLQGFPSSAYQTEFISCLLDDNWPEQQSYIIRWYFSVYIIYTVLSVVYMKNALLQEREERLSICYLILCFITLLFWLRVAGLEFFQAKSEGWRYLCSFWNLVDLIGLFGVFWILVFTGTNTSLISIENERIIAAFASCFTLIKLYDWLRLFDSTAFYVLLVAETLADIKPFMMLLSATLLLLGVPILILDGNRVEDENKLLNDAFGFWILDLLYTQYMLALGMFEPEHYGLHPQHVIAFCFFIAATFISQLTILNMLIAVMGDSFDKVVENREVNSIIMKLELLGDLCCNLPQTDRNVNRDTHMIVVEKLDKADDEGEDWEGTIRRLTKIVTRNARDVKNRIGQKVDKLQSTIEDNSKREMIQARNMRVHVDQTIKTQCEKVHSQVVDELRSDVDQLRGSMNERIDNVDSKIDTLIAMMQERQQE